MIISKPRIYFNRENKVWCCQVGDWGICGCSPLEAYNNLMELFSARGLDAQAS